MKTLWIIGAGPESCPAIERGLALGHRVVASDRNPGAPGLRLAHHGVVASVYDPDETLGAARTFARDHGRVDGVLCVAADAPATAARLAAEFGLRGVDATSAHLATDKLAMKERFAADGVPVPWFSAVRDARHLGELVRRHAPPLVIKPVDSRGARGVIRILDGVDPTWAFEAARRHSPSGRVLLERFVAGPQLSTESLVIDGRCHTPGLADRNYEHLERFHPFVIEDGATSRPRSRPRSWSA